MATTVATTTAALIAVNLTRGIAIAPRLLNAGAGTAYAGTPSTVVQAPRGVEPPTTGQLYPLGGTLG